MGYNFESKRPVSCQCLGSFLLVVSFVPLCGAKIPFSGDVQVRIPFKSDFNSFNLEALSVGIYASQVIMTLIFPRYLSVFPTFCSGDYWIGKCYSVGLRQMAAFVT